MWMIQWPEPNNVQSWFCTISYSSWISILSSTGASWTSGNEIAAPVRPFQFRMLLRIRTSYQSLSYTVFPGVVSVVHCIWDTAIASTFIHWVRNTCCSSLTRYSIPTVEKNERKKKRTFTKWMSWTHYSTNKQSYQIQFLQLCSNQFSSLYWHAIVQTVTLPRRNTNRVLTLNRLVIFLYLFALNIVHRHSASVSFERQSIFPVMPMHKIQV